MGSKPSIPKGTRDFGPAEMIRRNYIFDSVRRIFRLYGYLPLATPAMENLDTLLGKYGEEGDKLLFRILDSGDFLSGVDRSGLNGIDSKVLAREISGKGLKYDLTVPFARYVVQNRNSITFPFKRFQIQPVWRADRPQKGRYREFYQCDVDVIGSDSLSNEFELILIINDLFSELGIRNRIRLNNRKILAGMAELIGAEDRVVDVTIAIDKLDKIGLESVNLELEQKGVSSDAITKLQPFLFLEGDNENKLIKLEEALKESEKGVRGIEEMKTLLRMMEGSDLDSEIVIDLTLARGLNYYTGVIIEVESIDVAIGSICGGGRYDNLTGIFGLDGVSGVGVSFGADRIYDVMTQLNLFPENIEMDVAVLFVNFGEKEARKSQQMLKILRDKGICSEIYPDQAKIKKQFSYANSRNIPYVAVIGEEEIGSDMVTLKIMQSGEQVQLPSSQLVEYLRKNL